MKEITLTDNFLRKFKLDCKSISIGLNSNFIILGNESVRYYNDDEMLKIILDKHLTEDRESIVRGIGEFEHPNLVLPKYILTEHDRFKGYGMEYLKGYIHFETYLRTILFLPKEERFNELKRNMLLISKIFDYFRNNKFAYFDIHPFNIMYKDGILKIIDLDGGVLYPYINDGLNYETAIRLAEQNLARFIFTALLNIDDYEFYITKQLKNDKYFKSFLEELPQIIKDFILYTLLEEYNLFDERTQSLKELTFPIFEETEDIIRKKLSNY